MRQNQFPFAYVIVFIVHLNLPGKTAEIETHIFMLTWEFTKYTTDLSLGLLITRLFHLERSVIGTNDCNIEQKHKRSRCMFVSPVSRILQLWFPLVFSLDNPSYPLSD